MQYHLLAILHFTEYVFLFFLPNTRMPPSLLTADGTSPCFPGSAKDSASDYSTPAKKLRADLSAQPNPDDKRQVFAKLEEAQAAAAGPHQSGSGGGGSSEMIDHLMTLSWPHCQRVDRLVERFVTTSLPQLAEDRDRLFRSFCHLLEQLLFCLVEWSRATEGFQNVSVSWPRFYLRSEIEVFSQHAPSNFTSKLRGRGKIGRS